MSDQPEKPAFEIHNGCEHIRIYASGRVEGIAVTAGPLVIINRIPQLLRTDHEQKT